MALPLPTEDYKAFTKAMLSAFLSITQLQSLLFLQLGKRLDAIVAPGPLNDLVPALLMVAVSEGWFEQLEAAVQAERPENPLVKEYFATRRRVATSTKLAGADLERLLRLDLPFLDPIAFAAGLLRASRAVCRIDIDSQPQGTGFLVAPDLVLTNHHVLDALLPRAPAEGDRVVCWFDRTEGGTKRSAALAPAWLVAHSPPSPLDTQPREARGGKEPDTDALDYALVRLAERVGDDGAVNGGAKRGFLVPRVGSQSFNPDAPLQILQHPSGNPLAFRTDTKAIVAVNAGRTRVRYRTNTAKGSSGSPCFDEHWNLIALHHSGESEYQKAEWNEGIPIDTVFDNLPDAAREAVEASRGAGG